MRRRFALVLAVGLIVVGGASAGGQEPPKKETPDPKKVDPKKLDPNSAAGQSLRWVLRFRTKSGKDYVEQLAAVGCVLLVPIPPDNKRCLIVEDLRKPTVHKAATDDDIKELAKKVRFSDRDKESVKSVAEVLGMDFTPRIFYAFFPDELRTQLLQMEKDYQKLEPKDIEETIFSVTIKDGKPTFTIVEQKRKK